MRTIADKRSTARQIGARIQQWSVANIKGYDATNWSGENLSDYLFDKAYKHQTENLWYVELDDENVFGYPVMELPEGWFPEIEPLT